MEKYFHSFFLGIGCVSIRYRFFEVPLVLHFPNQAVVKKDPVTQYYSCLSKKFIKKFNER